MRPSLRYRVIDFLLGLLALCAIAGCSPLQVRAQITKTIPATQTQTLAATGTACTGANQFFPINNLGQTQHTLIALASGSTSFRLVLYGVDQNGNFVQISDRAEAAGFGSPIILIGSGYFPQFSAQVNCSGGTFGLTYVGSSSQPVPNIGGYLQSAIDKVLWAGASATVGQLKGAMSTPYGNSAGVLSFLYSGASGATGSTITISCISATSGTLNQSFTFTIANNTNNQNFVMPAAACPAANVAYNPGSSPSGTFTLEYVFNNPASPPSISGITLNAPINDAPQIAEKGARWSVVSTPASGTQSSASKAAGGAGIYHVTDCIAWSGGATTAPTATALTLNLRNGATGAGTIIFSLPIVAPASAGQNIAPGSVCGLNLIGSANTAMTLEFSAGLTNELEGVTLSGYDVQ